VSRRCVAPATRRWRRSRESYRGAYRLLADHRDLLDEIAERLLANEVLERDEIGRIMPGRDRSGVTPPRELEERQQAEDLPGDRAQALASEPPDESP
jgi:hypothetical protein